MSTAWVHLAAILGLILGAVAVHACTSGAYTDPRGFISWRLLDLPSTYFNSMAYVPAGIDMQLLPVAGRTYSSLGRTIKVRNSFVCMTSSEDILQLAVAASDTGLVMDTAKWPGSCGDGMNDKGLHIGALMQDNSTGINRYNTAAEPYPAVEQVDFLNFILATYDDVPSIKAGIADGSINPVLNPNFEIITRVMFQTNYSTVHYTIHDAEGNSMVIEYSGPNNLQVWDSQSYNGALANNPLWEPQTEYYNWWFNTYADPYITFHDSKFLNLPGSYNSSHRFARAAKLPEAGYIWEWPKDIEVSPRYTDGNLPETNPALIATQAVISSVYLPKGVDDAGGRQCEGCNTHRDIVWFAFIADHKLNAYYYRVANSPQWKRIALDQVDFEDMGGCIRYVKVQGSQWWVDESNLWAHKHPDEQRAAQMTIDALKSDIAHVQADPNFDFHRKSQTI